MTLFSLQATTRAAKFLPATLNGPRYSRSMRTLFLICCLCALGFCAMSAEENISRPVNGIMDNSFLIEEAYNQEPGIVQHIFNAAYSLDRISGTTLRRFD